MARKKLSRNAPCPCGSGKKYKHCCWGKGFEWEEDEAGGVYKSVPVSDEVAGVLEEQRRKYPVGTVALYGPDDKTTTKIAAAVIRREGAEPILERWVGTDVATSPKVQKEIRGFFERHGVRSVAMAEGNLGCPHEEGEDFPVGEDCPFCPFWKGKQGSSRQD